MRKSFLLTAIGATVVATMLALAWGQPGPEQTQAASQGSAVAMELRAPANVEVGNKFTVSIVADLSPSVPIAGFQADVETDPALKYSGTSGCPAEIKVNPIGGGPLESCASFETALGGRGLFVLTQSAIPANSLDVPTSSKVVLANLSYQCNQPGTHTITLVSSPPFPFGAAYFSTGGGTLSVKTDAPGIADAVSVSCVSPLTKVTVTLVSLSLNEDEDDGQPFDFDAEIVLTWSVSHTDHGEDGGVETNDSVSAV